MKIALAQTRSIKGDITRNIQDHLAFVAQAATQGADLLVFPELSITGYEPTLAKQLATTAEDSRFDVFQEASDQDQMTIGIGVPLNQPEGLCISMLIFQPYKPRLVYSKQYLHADEEPFFVCGSRFVGFLLDRVALAICYEISIPDHSQQAANRGATIYLTSVAKTASGVGKAWAQLSEIAKAYSMTVLMANCVGPNDDFIAAGQSAVWNSKGERIVQLNDSETGLLVVEV